MRNKKIRHLVMLCDYGLDDAIATAHLFAHSALLEKVDIVAVGGNFPADVALANARKLLFHLDTGKTSVRIVDTVAVPQPAEAIYCVHGSDGMGGIFPVPAPGAEKVPVISYASWLASLEGCDLLLSLGPMTLTREVLARVGSCEFLFMAGCVHATPNYKGMEFNQGINTDAFAACLAYPHRGVLLDTAAPLLQVPDTLTGEGLIPQMTARYRELCRANGEETCYVWDDLAVCALLYPELFRTEVHTLPDGNKVSCLFYTGDMAYPLL